MCSQKLLQFLHLKILRFKEDKFQRKQAMFKDKGSQPLSQQCLAFKTFQDLRSFCVPWLSGANLCKTKTERNSQFSTSTLLHGSMHVHTVQKNKIISLKSFIIKIIQIGKSTKHIKTAFSYLFIYLIPETPELFKNFYFSLEEGHNSSGFLHFHIPYFTVSLFPKLKAHICVSSHSHMAAISELDLSGSVVPWWLLVTKETAISVPQSCHVSES